MKPQAGRTYLSIRLWWPLGNDKQIVQNIFIFAFYKTFFGHIYSNQLSNVYGESWRTKYILDGVWKLCEEYLIEFQHVMLYIVVDQNHKDVFS